MKTTLYLGTDPTEFNRGRHASGRLLHYPVIKIVPLSLEHPEIKSAYTALAEYTHLLFTSKNAVKVFFEHLSLMQMSVQELTSKTVIAIGAITAAHLASRGLCAHCVAPEETQEGVVQLLSGMHLEGAYFFMPRSSLARPVLAHFFKAQGIRCLGLDVYTPIFQAPEPRPDLHAVDEIVFTSPSTVRAFLALFGKLPQGKRCLAIGPVTMQALAQAGIDSELLI